MQESHGGPHIQVLRGEQRLLHVRVVHEVSPDVICIHGQFRLADGESLIVIRPTQNKGVTHLF